MTKSVVRFHVTRKICFVKFAAVVFYLAVSAGATIGRPGLVPFLAHIREAVRLRFREFVIGRMIEEIWADGRCFETLRCICVSARKRDSFLQRATLQLPFRSFRYEQSRAPAKSAFYPSVQRRIRNPYFVNCRGTTPAISAALPAAESSAPSPAARGLWQYSAGAAWDRPRAGD